MRIDYLAWAKDLHRELSGRKDRDRCCNLASSAILEPRALLRNHVGSCSIDTLFDWPDPWGNARLAEMIASRNGMRPENVLLTNGASQGMFIVCQAFLGKGDHAVVETPVYEPLMAVPEFLGAELSYLPRRPEDGFRMRLDAFESMVTSRTKLVILTNLHNPSGAFLRDEDLRDVLTILKKKCRDARIVVDEVYHDFVAEKQPPAAALDEGVISLNSLSKVYGLGFLRCGWILASGKTMDAVRRMYVLAENCDSPVNEAIASVMMAEVEDYTAHWRSVLSSNRKTVCELANPLIEDGFISGSIPEDGCIFFPEIVGVDDAGGFVREMAEKHNVFVVPGSFFGSPDYVRIGFGGRSEELKTGLEKLVEFIRNQ
ncbi:MAG: pyridoxal phosphate-dependent aminotransferase [bacterium]